MSAEAEATDILVRMTMEGIQYCFRFTGEAASKGLALFFAGVRTLYDRKQGKQKLGGKIKTRAFLDNFVSSSVFPLSKTDLDRLKPELKRLHIPYMQYKTTKEMKNEGHVEISVRRDDADRFVRLAESLGIASVKPYDLTINELSPEAYEQAMTEGNAKGVDIKISEDGAIVNEQENPTQAPIDRSLRLEPNSTESSPFNMTFDDKAGITPNLDEAYLVNARRDGRLIPISANKSTLLVSEAPDKVVLTIPGTMKQERLIVPKKDVVSMDADGGKSVRVDLRSTHLYEVVDQRNQPLRKVTGAEIKEAGKWAIQLKSHKKPEITLSKKGGVR